MAIPVAYSLSPDHRHSDAYYERIREFTDEVVKRASEPLKTSVTEFKECLRTSRGEKLRSDEEYALDILSFGLFWKSYAGSRTADRRAGQMPRSPSPIPGPCRPDLCPGNPYRRR